MKKEIEVTQLCPTHCDPMDCSLPGSSIHGIFQARILEWVALSFSSKWRDWVPNAQQSVGFCYTLSDYLFFFLSKSFLLQPDHPWVLSTITPVLWFLGSSLQLPGPFALKSQPCVPFSCGAAGSLSMRWIHEGGTPSSARWPWGPPVPWWMTTRLKVGDPPPPFLHFQGPSHIFSL